MKQPIAETLPRREAFFLILGVVLVLIWSGVLPRDRLTWFMEVIWVMIGLPLVIWAWKRFPLTRLLCWLLAIHAVILMVGGRYTYVEVPIGLWIRDAFDLSRNHYDRLGHFAQGFIPAILARELLLRRTPLRPGPWLFYLVVSCSLAFSAFFEFLEWWAAVAMGGRADAFLATQGDIWDTQWDMFLAMCGAILAQLIFAKMHSRQVGVLAPL